MAANCLEWHKYFYEGAGCWWWHETNDDWFLEASPGPWERYLDPTSTMQYWWRDDANWFWIYGSHGKVEHSLVANAEDGKHLSPASLESSAELAEKPSLHETNSCGAQAYWTCHRCDEVNKAGRSQCNCCGADALLPNLESEKSSVADPIPHLPARSFVAEQATPPPTSMFQASPHATPEKSLPAEPIPRPPARSFVAEQVPLPPSSVFQASHIVTPSCNHAGLPLLGDCSPAGVTWQYPLRDDTQHSYVGHLSEWLSSKDAKALLRTVMDGMDDLGWERPPLQKRSGSSGGGGAHRGVIIRSSKWLVRDGCCCTYRHEVVNTQDMRATPFPKWMNKLMQACMPACGLTDPATWPNSCILQCYADGSEAMDWHCDNESLFGGLSEAGERIISLALGSERVYELRPSDTPKYADSNLCSCSLLVKGGDMLSMEGKTPKYYMHRVPKYVRKGGERVPVHVSLTWRWIVTHQSKRCRV